MRALIFLTFSSLIFLGLAIAWLKTIRSVYPQLWARDWFKRTTIAMPIVWAIAMGTGLLARKFAALGLARFAVTLGGSILVLIVCTFPLLLLARLLRAGLKAPTLPSVPAAPAEPSTWTGPKTSRRVLLSQAASIVPVGGIFAAGEGAINGFSSAQVRRIEMFYKDLPDALDGFKILHYTDMHLGTFIDMAEVRRLTRAGAEAKPDLVVLTGDMSDDLDALPEALKLFEALAPEHGIWASIGNHEYFRGLKRTLSIYDRTDIPMLIERGIKVQVKETTLYIAGADDPRRLRGEKMNFMTRTVNAAIDGAPSDAFRLLLSHRPEGFVPASQVGFHLTLSGHTHGAQLGFNGRSLLEDFMPDNYLWGAYSANNSRLYTSAGAGHWFPFRLGCPRELPMIVLKKGTQDTRIVSV